MDKSEESNVIKIKMNIKKKREKFYGKSQKEPKSIKKGFILNLQEKIHRNKTK